MYDLNCLKSINSKTIHNSHLGPHIPVDVVEPQNVHVDGHFHCEFDVGEK